MKKKEEKPSVQDEKTAVGAVPAEKPPEGEPLPKLCTDVGQLAPDLRKLVEEMLVEGAPFEDVLDALDERHRQMLTLTALENFFRRNLELQKRRVRRQVEGAQELRKALGGRRSAEKKLAEAVLFSGYLGLNRNTARVGLKEAERGRLDRENLRLKQHLLRIKQREALQKESLNRARIQHELAKWRLVREKFRHLRRALKETGQDRSLGPETLQRIQQIYGLITEPYVPKCAQAPAAQT